MGRLKRDHKNTILDKIALTLKLDELSFHIPYTFDGTISQYRSYLKFLDERATKAKLEILIHLDGEIKLERKQINEKKTCQKNDSKCTIARYS